MRKDVKKFSRREGQLGRAVAQALEGRVLLSTTWIVTSLADDGSAGTLRSILGKSTSGDTIEFSASLTSNGPATITLDGRPLSIGDDLTIYGPGASQLAINGSHESTILSLPSPTTDSISGLTLTNGYAFGASVGGGAILANGGGKLSLSDLNITGNHVVGNGGGIFVAGGTLNARNITFSDNSATSMGGAAAIGDSTGVLFFNCIFDSNSASGTNATGGGAISTTNLTSVNVNYCTFTGNSTSFGSSNGGAIFGSGNLLVANSSFDNNHADGGNGGAIFVTSYFTLTTSSFAGNQAINEGHGGFGGAIYGSTPSASTITSCEFDSNSAVAGPGSTLGGAVCDFGYVVVNSSTFNGNSAGQGGGIYASVTLWLINSTFTRNTAAQGGGMYLLVSDFHATVTNCTISGNAADSGGGVTCSGPTTDVSFSNNIVSGNVRTGTTTADDVDTSAGAFGSFNLIGSSSLNGQQPGPFVNGVNNNIVGVTNPQLSGPVDVQAEPVQVLLLSPGSPAIDAGSNALALDQNGQSLTTDETGATRIVGNAIDLGAVEYVPLVLTAPVVTETAVTNGIGFSWTSVTGAASYAIYRRTLTGTASLIASRITSHNYTDTTGTPETQYYYSVRAVNGTTLGPQSNEILTFFPFLGSVPTVYVFNDFVPAAVEGVQTVVSQVAYFTDTNPVSTSTPTATINWGDGTSGAGTISYDTGDHRYIVSGQHTWTTAGTYTDSVHVVDSLGNGSATSTGTVTVHDQALIAVGTAITANTGKSFTGVVGSFTDADPNAKALLYTATITWGDGHTSSGTIAFNSTTKRFDVSGTNTYASANTYSISIAVKDVGGSTTTISSSAKVSGVTPPGTSVITAAAVNFSTTKGISVSPTLATFTDSHAGQAPSHYTASINWGDSTTSAGTVTLNTITGKFQVSGSHTYKAVGSFNVTVYISDPEGGSAAPVAKATVADAAITPFSATINATPGKAFTGVIGSFGDGDPSAPASYFSATITWGDGHSSAGTIAYNTTTKHFDVSGSNTYATANTYPISIAVKDVGGASATISSTAKVSTTTPPGNSVLKGTGVSIAEVKGAAFSNVLLATFSDTTPNQTAGYYKVTITWGDGTTSAGAVSYNATTKLFQVTGSHTYHTAANFYPVIAISDSAGGSTSVTSKIYVADAPMHAYPTTFSATAGKAFSGVVGSFVDGDPSSIASDFTATINWGDGHTSTGTVTLNAVTKRFDIHGTNTFAVGGVYAVNATPHDVGGMSVAIKSTANVTVVAGPQPKISGPTSDKEGSSEAISFSATDVGGKAITKWVIDWGDGTVQTLAGTATSDSHVYADGPATRIVKATATDAANLSATAALTVGVLNVAPTAVFTGGTAVQPGHASTVSFSSAHDPSPVDTAAGFRYSFDFNNEGKFEIVNATSGTATVPATYLATIGTKTIHGRISDKDGGYTDYYTTIDVVAQPLNTVGTTIKVVEGTKFSGNVGSFADPSGNTNPAIYTATITWGDGHTSAGAIAYNATTKSFGVSGSNTYALLGGYAISVAVKSNTSAAGTIKSAAQVSDAALASAGSNISGKEGVSLLGDVATFTDSNSLALGLNYVVSINWGDGSAASTGTVSYNATTRRWQVAGGHTYRIGGSYTITTAISDHGTSSTKATSTATIAGSTLHAQGVTLTVLNSALATTPQLVATFTSSNPLLTASDFSATIDWGDGTTNNPTSRILIVWDATNKVFDVMATHPYSLLLIPHTATITITEGRGASATSTTSTIYTN